MQISSESQNSTPLVTRPSMFSKVEYIHPDSATFVERVFDMWLEKDRIAMCKLIQWSACNRVELRINAA